MNKKIALPLQNGVLCEHFGHCQQFAIIEVENGAIVNIDTQTPPAHEPGVYPRWVAQYGVTDVIAAGMGQRAINLFHEQNINVFIGAPLIDPKEIVTQFMDDKLQLSANYCGQGDKPNKGSSNK
ncbi:MAG TPA: NifB/NifX family molybdenum-iron cluster-binding protein [Perlabentimonas sp.]|jgi:predicted Fe-Mo cluster-binding NifX family protein|nr:NifB/NifX family molybdenum-iron cluster-binding protein [Bacteroidales bacterium]MDD4672938.1 NifB/NifX family molybdenum-iron cluster-binding protein [Bacteroidales bacterium]MDY0348902.1 NifB/NifX family molybdenum-iron cluster-binding protein [Tenuifilaceae bacterium]HZJ74170.1 NifB/NifX family molybdenum-iron cluster-binding protein [Perlabentimonas sp.]